MGALMAWQPIETAPKETAVLTINGFSGTITVSIFDCEMWWEQHMEYSLQEPTHWMPLPDPPKEK